MAVSGVTILISRPYYQELHVYVPAFAVCALAIQPSFAGDRVKTANGVLESTAAPKDGVRSFKGIPFGQPPVGDLRWREPQPVKNWKGVRNADEFGPRCMQRTRPARTTGSAATA